MTNKKKKELEYIYHMFFEEYGECDVFFDKHGDLIDYWYGNDASWRQEYYSGLLAWMGYEVFPPDKKLAIVLRKNFEQRLRDDGQGYMVDEREEQE